MFSLVFIDHGGDNDDVGGGDGDHEGCGGDDSDGGADAGCLDMFMSPLIMNYLTFSNTNCETSQPGVMRF